MKVLAFLAVGILASPLIAILVMGFICLPLVTSACLVSAAVFGWAFWYLDDDTDDGLSPYQRSRRREVELP